MTDHDLIVEKLNDVYIQIHCDESIAYELSDYFSFFAKDYKFMPAYQHSMWDGKVRLFDVKTHKLYAGLIYELIEFAIKGEFTVEFDEALELPGSSNNTLPRIDFTPFIESMNLPFTPYDYQVTALSRIINLRRQLILLPTASGKSLVMYFAARYALENNHATKLLIVVPTTSLVEQLCGDFEDYSANNGWDVDAHVNKIYAYAGVSKNTDKLITISTWQSIYKFPKEWFAQFDAVMVDEAHSAVASSLTSILKKMSTCGLRIGLTGTIEDSQTHILVLQGLLGRIVQLTTTRKMIDRGIAPSLQIKGVILQYPDADRKAMAGMNYAEEIRTIVADDRRNNFIARLALSQTGNTLVLFNLVEHHGKPLYRLINKLNTNGNKKIFYVSGEVGTTLRESIRAYAEKNNNVIIVASYGTFSTGINIKNLDVAIFAHPYKAKIKNLQSIGRILRKSMNATTSILYDICDDYSWGSSFNTTLKHFNIRLNIYMQEKFDYSINKLIIR